VSGQLYGPAALTPAPIFNRKHGELRNLSVRGAESSVSTGFLSAINKHRKKKDIQNHKAPLETP
jgi:hypothetical protein